MVWTDIKSARPPAISKALQKWNEHKIVAISELHYTDANVHKGNGKQETDKPYPTFAIDADESEEKVNQQTTQDRVDVGPSKIRNWRHHRPQNDVAKKKDRADQAKPLWRWLGPSHGQ